MQPLKEWGTVVYATDVRMASKEQVESLGGKFLIEDLKGKTEGGYAKLQVIQNETRRIINRDDKKIDVIICTALFR